MAPLTWRGETHKGLIHPPMQPAKLSAEQPGVIGEQRLSQSSSHHLHPANPPWNS